MAEARKNELLIKAYLVLGLVMLLALAILGRVMVIQWVEGDKWRAQAEKSQLRYVPVEAEKGSIITESGAILASTVATYELRMDLNSSAMNEHDFQQEVDSLGWYISHFVDRRYSGKEWAKKLRQGRKEKDRYYRIHPKLSVEKAELVKTFPMFRKGQFKGGIILLERLERERPFEGLASRTVGSIRKGAKPVGLEGRYQSVICGEDGMRLMQRLPGNILLPINDLTEIAPKPGKDIVTTLDMGMQDIAHHALTKALSTHQAESGVAIVMDVETGFIRAMVNLDKSGNGYEELYNHAIGSAVEPGSVFKLASYMALLEDGYAKPDDLIDLEKGETKFYNNTLKDAHYHGIDTTTVSHAFEISSNVGVAKLIQRYYGAQPEAFTKRIKSFGVGQITGVDLAGEAHPILKEPTKKDNWSGITLPWMSMGYEVEMTPLQILNLYAAVANSGKMMKPKLVSEIQRQGEPLKQFHPEVLDRRIASSKVIRQMRTMLEGVVIRGTASRMASPLYAFAGKTGTAQIGYQHGKEVAYRSSFVGYFPADKPKYAAIVVVTDPHNGYYGSEVALPVFREIADYCFSSRKEMFEPLQADLEKDFQALNIPQWEVGNREDFHRICMEAGVPKQDNGEGEWAVSKIEEEDRLHFLNRILPEQQVPNVLGMGLRDALYLLENSGLKVDVIGVGKVRRQSVPAGKPAHGQYVRINLE
ncbi:MAG: transpeptidase family protein [Saprospiraceae bacterium]|nr:transpeptidase family protein [Saprospiraceae bacterium]